MKLNLNVDKEKLNLYLVEFLQVLPILVVVIVLMAYGLLAFFSLYTVEDSTTAKQGEERVKELDIKFNTKTLNELKTTKTPTSILGNGGRDPFSSF
jgi:hypothetical protein